MYISDPIGDSLTRIRNAQMRMRESVEFPYTKILEKLMNILQQKGYVSAVNLKDGKIGKNIEVVLKYDEMNKPVIRSLKRISKPGLRKYVAYNKVPNVLNGMGISIVSTSKGMLTGDEAKQMKVGGELVCTLY